MSSVLRADWTDWSLSGATGDRPPRMFEIMYGNRRSPYKRHQTARGHSSLEWPSASQGRMMVSVGWE